MKKLIITLLTCISFNLFVYSQTDSIHYSYCQLVGTSGFLTNKVTVSIDYGQEMKYFSDQRIKDDAGNPIKFNSMIDALNYMAKNGWEHLQAYAITMGNTNVYHHLLKRKEVKAE
jgi:hypothetical protein